MKAKLTFNFYLNILPHRRRLLHSSTSSLSLLSCLHPSVFVLLMSCRLLTFPTFSSLSASSSKSNYTSSFVFLGFLRAPSILDLCFFKTRPTLTKLERNFDALIQLMQHENHRRHLIKYKFGIVLCLCVQFQQEVRCSRVQRRQMKKITGKKEGSDDDDDDNERKRRVKEECRDSKNFKVFAIK